MLRKNSLLAFGLLFLVCSCDKQRVFDEYKTLDGKWNKDSLVSFEFENKDTVSRYNMFVNIRNNNSYPFNNLFLIVQLYQPGGLVQTDTLEYMMANKDGSLMGEGFSDVKESKLWYKKRERLTKLGKYKVRVQQAVRPVGKIEGIQELDGVTEIGFRIESTE